MVTLVNRAKVSTSTIGTGSLALGPAVDGFQSFAAAGVADGDMVRYVIEEGTAWEIGTGIYATSGPSLTRSPSESSTGGGPITLSGNAVVFITATASDISTDLSYVAAATSGEINSSTGASAPLPAATPSLAGLLSAADKTKLDGIAPGAEVNTVTSVAGKTGAVALLPADLGAADAGHGHGHLTAEGRIGSIANRVIVTETGGTVNAKPAGATSQYLRGDGNWAVPPNTTYLEISTSEIDAGTSSTRRTITGRRMGYALAQKADLAHGHDLASTAQAGFLSPDDKAKLDGLDAALNAKTSRADLDTAVSALTNRYDGGAAASVYLPIQQINGGSA